MAERVDRVEEQIKKHIIIVFRDAIVDKVIPSEILPFMVASVSTLKAADEQIRERERTQGNKKAVELLVERLLESQEPGWFRTFINALSENGYDGLVKTLEGTETTEGVNDDPIYRALLDIFEPILCKVKPSELIPYLISKRCLIGNDEETIRHRERHYSPTEAAHLLLSKIHRRKQDYFMHFLEALKSCGYNDIVKEIEPVVMKTCNLEETKQVVEQIPKVYTIDVDVTSQMDAVSNEQEHQMEYSSMEVDRDVTVMAENRPLASEAESGLPETVIDDASFENNLRHFHDDTDTSSPTFNFHQNIPVNNNLNLPETGMTDDIESVADNTMMQGAEVGRGQPLELRNYQKELAQDAVKGKNTIVVAPTGSGKTHVAVYIAKCHLEDVNVLDERKVVFLVPTVSLVKQQNEMFKTYLPSRKTIALCGDATSAQLALECLIPRNDIFIMTPQILVDALNEDNAEINISTFSLLIFDECHHTVKGHPYSKVMAYYLDKKVDRDDSVPQIVGLTASVGVGKAKNVTGAVEYILTLCATLDAEKLRTVHEHRQDLMIHTPRARDDETIEVPGRRVDPFKGEINELMRLIEIKLANGVQEHGQQIGELVKRLKAPSDRGGERYTQWVNSLNRPIAMIRDSNMKQLVFACIRHLKMYNDALVINAVCQTLDALTYIHNDLDKIKQSYPNDTEIWLESIFKEREEAILDISRDVRYSNPKLEKLREQILNFYEEDLNSRGIVFCKTRAMTEALVRWMRETPDLQWLNPKRLVAANAPTDRGGMVLSEQDDVLRYFRDGQHKVIVATSIAEEGLDIQACNFVIRYEHVTNETARIQARGRARKRDARYQLVTETGSGTAEKDELNRIREELMDDAIRKICNMDPDVYTKRVKHYQNEAKQKRGMELLSKQVQMERKRRMPLSGDNTLLCMKCDEFVCFSSDIRRIEKSHHVIIDPDFKDRAHVKKHHRPQAYDSMNKMGKLHCDKCNKDWGVVVRYKNIYFPVLKLSEFSVEDENGRRICYKKWKDVPFVVGELTTPEMQNLVQGTELVNVNF